jgi:hypothetical protein
MLRTRVGVRLPYRSQPRRLAKSTSFPRWITVPFVLIIGLMLWLGVLSDPSGKLATPGIGSVLYVAGVIGVAAFLAYADRNRNTGKRDWTLRDGFKRRRTATHK